MENNVEDLEDEISKAQKDIEEKTSQVEELTVKLAEAQAEILELKGGPSGHDDNFPKCGKTRKRNFRGVTLSASSTEYSISLQIFSKKSSVNPIIT